MTAILCNERTILLAKSDQLISSIVRDEPTRLLGRISNDRVCQIHGLVINASHKRRAANSTTTYRTKHPRPFSRWSARNLARRWRSQSSR
jgi:hypothetical protein